MRFAIVTEAVNPFSFPSSRVEDSSATPLSSSAFTPTVYRGRLSLFLHDALFQRRHLLTARIARSLGSLIAGAN
jgi:hypothetical protein